MPNSREIPAYAETVAKNARLRAGHNYQQPRARYRGNQNRIEHPAP
jgi:hypothetical protein